MSTIFFFSSGWCALSSLCDTFYEEDSVKIKQAGNSNGPPLSQLCFGSKLVTLFPSEVRQTIIPWYLFDKALLYAL